MAKTTRISIVVLLVVGFCGAACRRTDIRTTEIETTGVRCKACVERIVEALSELRGIDFESIEIDVHAGITRITYDSMKLALKNLEMAIIDAGYDANDLPANPEAAANLPVDCRAHGD